MQYRNNHMPIMKNRVFHYLSLVLLGSFLQFNTTLCMADESSNQQDEEMNNLIVLAGASYVRDWPINSLACFNVTNTGIGGEVSTQVAQRFESDVLSRKPKIVVIWGYINDFHNNDKAEERNTAQVAYKNITSMAEKAKASGVIPVLATEVTMGVHRSVKYSVMQWLGKLRGKRSYQQYISENVLALNQRVREYASEQSIVLLDIEKLMTAEDGNRKTGYFTEDKSHISKEAYTELTNYAKSQLQKRLIDPMGLCQSS